VKFDELLAQQLSMRIAYRARRMRRAQPLRIDGPLLARFRKNCRSRSPARRRRAAHDILADLAKPHPMQRLLQGDVGSGKTIVAALACAAAADSGPAGGGHGAHRNSLRAALAQIRRVARAARREIVWLHGELSRAERRARSKRLLRRSLDRDRTHALFQKGVSFQSLALAIVDEQHRFGVQQRLALGKRTAGELVPHQLMMSATPIPRTLSMTYYADLDVS
jgi:ATP-dependent DNA helicase RecG